MRPCIGLTTDNKREIRCNKCDLLLEQSIYKNQKIVYCLSRRQVYLCIQCALRRTKSSKNTRTTIEDVDRFLCGLLGDKN